MIQELKNLVRKTVLGHEISDYFFSQTGEDAILQRIFSRKLAIKEKGFYVDIGAYHPTKHSNSYLFYINGWNGINVDARPGSMKEFKKVRPRDVNLEMGVARNEEILTYYFISEGCTMNSFSKQYLLDINKYKDVTKEIRIPAYPLLKILDEHVPPGQKIDFLDLDAEGLEYEILQSNDWEKYRPSAIIIEISCRTIDEIAADPCAQFLIALGYVACAKTVITYMMSSVIFIDKDFEI